MLLRPGNPNSCARRGVRARILHALFGALYSPFVFLHEPAGRLMFGEAWDMRRTYVLDCLTPEDVVLDLGCGEGRLLALANDRARNIVGLEPSLAMRKRARKRGVHVLAGSAQRVPLPDNSVDLIVSTYPGSWIFDPGAWREMRRLLAPRGRISVLVGGTYTRGPFARKRVILHRMAYGSDTLNSASYTEQFRQLGALTGICVTASVNEDPWGEAHLISGYCPDSATT